MNTHGGAVARLDEFHTDPMCFDHYLDRPVSHPVSYATLAFSILSPWTREFADALYFDF